MGRYRLVRKLAVGGMAEVFLAKVVGAQGFEKPVAVKRMLPSLAADPDCVELFLREAKLSVSLQHPNVVQVFDLGSIGKQYYLVMEFVDGQNVRELLREAAKVGVAVGVREGCWIVLQVAQGLAYAHERCDATGRPLGIVHRDVNPTNVMIGRNGEVKLADFGVAKAADGRATTQLGVVRGKAGYLSPEQILGQEVDQRSDIFLLGLLLFEILTGRRVFEAPSQYQAMQQIADFHPSNLQKPGCIPQALWQIVTRALEPDPAHRFQSARAVVDALEAFLFDTRLRVGPGEIATLFAGVFVNWRSPLEAAPEGKGEIIRFAGAAPPAQPPAERQKKGSLRGKPLGEILVAHGKISDAQLYVLLLRQQVTGGRLGEHLLTDGLVDELDLVRALSEQSGIPFISDGRLQEMPVPVELLDVLPYEEAERLGAVPLKRRGDELFCALRDPLDEERIAALAAATGEKVRGIFATAAGLSSALHRFYFVAEPEEHDPFAAVEAVEIAAAEGTRLAEVLADWDRTLLGGATAEEVEAAFQAIEKLDRPGPAPVRIGLPDLQLATVDGVEVARLEDDPILEVTAVQRRVVIDRFGADEPTAGLEPTPVERFATAPELAGDATRPDRRLATVISLPPPRGSDFSTRLRRLLLEPLGISRSRAVDLGALARGIAARLGLDAAGTEQAGAVATLLGLVAHLEGTSLDDWPSGLAAEPAWGDHGPLVAEVLAACNPAAAIVAGSPAALAVAAAVLFAARSPEVVASGSAAAAALWEAAERLPPVVAEALASEVAERSEGGAPVVLVDPEPGRSGPMVTAFLAAGMRSRLVRSGAAAYEAVTRGASALILPPVLPDTTALDLIRSVRSDPRWKDTTLLLGLGGDLHPLKASSNELVARVQRALAVRAG